MRMQLLFLIIFINISYSFLRSQTFTEHPHPFFYTEKKIKTAKANIQKYEWAQKLFNEIRMPTVFGIFAGGLVASF